MTQGVYRYQLSIQIDTKAGDGICDMKCLLKESKAWAQESTDCIAYRAYTLTYVQHTQTHTHMNPPNDRWQMKGIQNEHVVSRGKVCSHNNA